MSTNTDGHDVTPGMIIMPEGEDGPQYIRPDPAMIRILEKIVDQNGLIVDALGRVPVIVRSKL